MNIPEARITPQEDSGFTAECGCAVIPGRAVTDIVGDGYVYFPDEKGQLKQICIDCFVYEIERMLSRNPYEVAELMGLDAVEVSA